MKHLEQFADNIIWFVIFSLIGVGSVLSFIPVTYKTDLLIQECEKNLPRNHHCQLIAIPVEAN